jgi:hypothetical protein
VGGQELAEDVLTRVQPGVAPAALRRAPAAAGRRGARPMTPDAPLAAWIIECDVVDLGAVVRSAQDGELGQPDLELRLLSSTGDTIAVQVVDGVVPVDPAALLYVAGRGAYELLRRETWPGPRVLLTLAAWPAEAP